MRGREPKSNELLSEYICMYVCVRLNKKGYILALSLTLSKYIGIYIYV